MEMITFEQAYDIVLNSGFNMGTERIKVSGSLNRILAGNVISDINMPPFNKATVDGFACRKNDLGSDLEIVETIPAGKLPERPVDSKQCSGIMTGAAVPEGADCVIMVEDTVILPSGKVRYTGIFSKDNIAVRGEDIKSGDIVLKAGRQIRPQDIAVMASVGYTTVTVSKAPEIAVISTGSELVEPAEVPGMSQIRNSNAWQLMAQIERSGGSGKYYGIAKDDENETLAIVKKAISENDIVLISGGVSMGDFDFVPSVLERAGVRILFSGVAVQPGKPTTFGVHTRALVFGLPGNPVSSFMQFELLVRPLICKMMGCNFKPVTANLPMKERVERKSSDRLALIPVSITNDGLILAVNYHGSAHIAAIPYADGIISMPVGKKSYEKGEIVSVRQI